MAALGGASISVCASAGTILYVDDDAPSGGDGAGWATAFRYLQDALALVADGVEIRVAQGVYKPDRDEAQPAGTLDRAASFVIGFTSTCCYAHFPPECDDGSCEAAVCAVDPSCCNCCQNDWDDACVELAVDLCGSLCDVPSGVVLRGGYAGIGAQDPDERDIALYETVLSGDLLDNDVSGTGEYYHPSQMDNAYHVLVASGSDVLIDGFTVRGGVANVVNSPFNSGAGLHAITGNITIQSCAFIGNVSTDAGPAIGIDQDAGAALQDCTLSDNLGNFGGALAAVDGAGFTLVGCDLTVNFANQEGGAIYVLNGSLTATDCTISGNSNHTNNGGAIYAWYSPVTLSGCTISGNQGSSQGGGLYAKGPYPLSLRNCAFTGNSGSSGGGAFLDIFSTATLDGCTFQSNSTPTDGGALVAGSGQLSVTNCLFEDNSAGQLSGSGGGAVSGGSSATFLNCSFIGNMSGSSGGACRRFGTGARFIDCLFAGNTSAGSGGAMYFVFASDKLVNCTFRGNVAGFDGGALSMGESSDPVVSNCLFSGNQTAGDGGAVFSGLHCNPTFSTCTMAGNTSPTGAGGISINFLGSGKLSNCVLWGNVGASGSDEGAQITVAADSSADVDFSCIQGLSGALGGIGNIAGDPLFVDADGGDDVPGTEDDDLHLLRGSPCLDAGNNWGVARDLADLDGDTDVQELAPLDLDGNPRFGDDPAAADAGCGAPVIVDMGAYERAGTAANPVRVGDINGDGVVGIRDFLKLLEGWGPCGAACCPADLDIDGAVGLSDFAALLSHWTP